jgi:sirohydrochlorin cobaltochelatase
MKTAYLLVAHGSRDPQFGLTVDRLVATCAPKFNDAAIGSAYLELAPTPLVDQIVAFVEQCACSILKLLPLFLAPGVHSTQDLPAAVTAAQQILGTKCKLILLDYLGAAMPQILSKLRQSLPAASILLVHGSRQGGDFFTNLATKLNLQPAYWAICPPDQPTSTLADRVAELSTPAAIQTEIGILWYFLFPGKTATAIEAAISELKLRFPHSQLQSTALLGEHPLVIQEIEQLLRGDFS